MPEPVRTVTRGCTYIDTNDQSHWLAIGTRNGTFHLLSLDITEGQRVPSSANILISHKIFMASIRSISLHPSQELPYRGWIACGGQDGSLGVCDIFWKNENERMNSKKRKRDVTSNWNEKGIILRIGDRKQKKNDLSGVTCVRWDPFNPNRLMASQWEGVMEVSFCVTTECMVMLISSCGMSRIHLSFGNISDIRWAYVAIFGAQKLQTCCFPVERILRSECGRTVTELLIQSIKANCKFAFDSKSPSSDSQTPNTNLSL